MDYQFNKSTLRANFLKSIRGARWWIVLAALAILSLHLWSLMRYPAISDDEAWLVSRAWAFIQTGHQLGPLDAAAMDYVPGMFTLNQWLITAIQAGVLRFFSAPNLAALRVLSLVFGLALLGINYWLAYRLSGGWLATASTLLLALSPAFFYSAHLVRYDILAALFCYLSLAIVVNNQRGRFWANLAAGIILGLAIETHLNSLIFIPVIGIYFLTQYGLRFISQAACWGFAAGLGIGAIYYVALHILPYPQVFFQTNNLVFGLTLQPPILTLNLAKIWNGFVGTGNLLLAATGPLMALLIYAVFSLLKRRTQQGMQLLAINVTLIVSAALVIPLKNGHYAIYLAPAALWLAAAALEAVLKRLWSKSILAFGWKMLALGLTAGAIALGLLPPLQSDGYQTYQEAQAAVNAAVRPEESIIGPQAYWLGLYDHTYYSWELLFLYPRQNPGRSLADAFAHYKPDIMVIDPALDTLIVDNVDPASQWYYNHLSRKELEGYLSQNANEVTVALQGDHADILIYRFDWK